MSKEVITITGRIVDREQEERDMLLQALEHSRIPRPTTTSPYNLREQYRNRPKDMYKPFDFTEAEIRAFTSAYKENL